MGFLSRIGAALTRSAPVEAAGTGPRWGRGKRLAAPAREVTLRRQVAAERAQWLATSTAAGAAIVAAWTSNLIGDGPSVTVATGDPALRQRLGAAWDGWWSSCDAEDLDDLAGLLRRVAHSLVAAGEAFVVMEADETGALRLRTLDPRQIVGDLNRPLADGRQIVAGIELDSRGRRAAYWVRDTAPGFLDYVTAPRRIDARDVIHVFDRVYPGQQRGISWLAPVVTTLDQLAELDDSWLATANTASLYSGVLVNASGTPADEMVPAQGLAPGALVELPTGFDVKFSSPPVLRGASDFRRDLLRSVSAGAGLPFELVSHDLSQVNFSSARLGLSEFRQRVAVLRRTLFTARLIEPVWRRWLAHEALAGRLSAATAGSLPVSVAWPGWAAVDPLTEIEADILAIQNGLESRHAVIARRGRDPREVDAERAADTFTPAADGGNKQ